MTQWDWWQNATEKEIVGPIHENQPESGFYRRKNRDGSWVGIAIWREESGSVVALIGQRIADANEAWMWGAKNPITEAAYRQWEQTGRFPDDAPELAPIGHNLPDDPAEAMQLELQGETEIAQAFLTDPVETQERADQVAVWARRVGDLGKRAAEAHKAEKRPILDAGKAVDDKWRTIIEPAKELVAKMKKHIEPFLIAQKRREEERAAEARKAAEEAQRAAANAAPDEQLELVEKAREAEQAAIPTNARAGRTGAKVALRTEKRAKIVDYDRALMALKDRSEVRELVTKLANRAARAGIAIDGVEIEEVEKAA